MCSHTQPNKHTTSDSNFSYICSNKNSFLSQNSVESSIYREKVLKTADCDCLSLLLPPNRTLFRHWMLVSSCKKTLLSSLLSRHEYFIDHHDTTFISTDISLHFFLAFSSPSCVTEKSLWTFLNLTVGSLIKDFEWELRVGPTKGAQRLICSRFSVPIREFVDAGIRPQRPNATECCPQTAQSREHGHAGVSLPHAHEIPHRVYRSFRCNCVSKKR